MRFSIYLLITLNIFCPVSSKQKFSKICNKEHLDNVCCQFRRKKLDAHYLFMMNRKEEGNIYDGLPFIFLPPGVRSPGV